MKKKKLIPSVAVVLVYKSEIYFIKRQNHLKAFPGYGSFPGGKVDKTEADDPFENPMLSAFEPRLIHALHRELEEELQFDFHKWLRDEKVESINLIGIADTPEFNPIRFSTHFFKINLTQKPEFVEDRGEIESGIWASADSIYHMYLDGDVLAVPPTIWVLKGLSEGLEGPMRLSFEYDLEKDVPMIESIAGLKQFMPLSNTLPPANRTNCFLIGDEKQPGLLVDPSPKDEIEYQKLLKTLAGFSISKILITHHHGDHNEFCNQLAQDLNIGLIMSKTTHELLMRYRDDGYFAGIQVEFVKEGDAVGRWKGQDVVVMESPGHDEGQVCLFPRNKKWFIAGDLFQGIGSVVVGGEHGNMRKYFNSLKKVIDLNPQRVFPSHGIGLGGVNIIKKNLEHRQHREDQVLELYRQEKTIDQILQTMYFDVPESLWPYAKANIVSHLDKLREDKKI